MNNSPGLQWKTKRGKGRIWLIHQGPAQKLTGMAEWIQETERRRELNTNTATA